MPDWEVTCEDCDFHAGPYGNHWQAIQKSVSHRTEPETTNHETDISKTDE